MLRHLGTCISYSEAISDLNDDAKENENLLNPLFSVSCSQEVIFPLNGSNKSPARSYKPYFLISN